MVVPEKNLPEDLRFTPRESFLRWQEFAYQQLGNASNVMLLVAFAIAGASSLDFLDFRNAEHAVGNATTSDTSSIDPLDILTILAVMAAAFSIFCGAAVQNNRFNSFQLNWNITRRTWSSERMKAGGEPLQSDRGKTPDQLEEANETARPEVARFDRLTYQLFRGQAWCLVVAMGAFALAWLIPALTAVAT